MNKLVKQLEKQSTRIYTACILVMAVITLILGETILAVVEAAAALVLLGVGKSLNQSRQRELSKYIESVTYEAEEAKNSTMLNFPLPMVTYLLDSDRVVWGNQEFFNICGRKGPTFDVYMADLAPAYDGKWLLEGKRRCPDLVEVNGRRYQIHGNMVRGQGQGEQRASMGVTYWVDVTDYDEIKSEFAASRPVVMMILLDNYDEMVKNATDRVKNDVRNQVEDKIVQWIDGSRGILHRYDRDRYLFICERRFYDRLEAEKFTLVDEVHNVINISGIHSTISIGVGIEGASMEEDMEYATMSVEMALSRGGDQAVVRDRMTFEFYGGRDAEVETRTKVKSRVVANALSSIIKEASTVYIMGHRFADMDSIGAATGICCIARTYGKKARVILSEEPNAAEKLIAELESHKEYADVFITPKEAMLQANSRSVLIIVDTGRPEQVEDSSILQTIQKRVIIDHHRRAASYIENAALTFYEPYASSVCELTVELLEELVEQNDIQRYEAEAMLAGIVTDTKNFTIRTGERTFDAAAFLRRAGADTISVMRLMQDDMESMVSRYKVLEQARIYHENVCISALDYTVDRVVAAQAADEMLNISGVEASVVLFPAASGEVMLSARSIGDLNVQVLLEKLGGGGNKSAAGAQMKGVTVEQALDRLEQALDEYLS